MKCVVLTGITGSERRLYLESLKNVVKEPERLLIIDPWVKTQQLHPCVNEATILNIPDEDRIAYFKDAYEEITKEIENLRKYPNSVVAVVPAHSVFYWKSGFKDAINDEFIEWLSPDLFVTVISNMQTVKNNLAKDSLSRFPEFTFPEIINWRERELQSTNRWAKMYKKQHIIVSSVEPVATLYGILFTERKRIYFSYPMSHVSSLEMKRAKKLIGKLRNLNYIVFDPGSIDDTRYIGELYEKLKQDDLIARNELSHVASMVGNHTVELDYKLIEQSDMVVVRYPSVQYGKYIGEGDKAVPSVYIPLSAGVICEMVKGFRDGKEVIAAWLPKVEPSPFFKYHCLKLFTSERDLLDYLVKKDHPTK